MNKLKSRTPKPKCRSRFLKNNFEIMKNHIFNLERPPYGYNYILGYCEQANIS
jgi:hypothetical protein